MKNFGWYLLQFGVVLTIFSFTPCPKAAYPMPVPIRPQGFPLRGPQDLGTVIGWNEFGTSSTPISGKCLAVSAGIEYGLALKADRTVVGWGKNDVGQSSPPTGLSNVVAVVAGIGISAALRMDGTVVHWGSYKGLGPYSNIVALSGYRGSLIGIRVDGSVVAWSGSTPLGVPLEATDAVAVSVGEDVGGAFVGGALTTSGLVVHWKFNSGPTTMFGNGHVAISQGGLFRLTENGTTAGRIVAGDVRAISSNRPGLAVIFSDEQKVWIDTGFRQFVPPDSANTISISFGYQTYGFPQTLGLISAGPSVPASATAVVVNGFVVGLSLSNKGNNYVDPPAISIVGGGGSNATAIAEISEGEVTGFKITNAGSGYTGIPEVRIGSPWFEPTVSPTGNFSKFAVTSELNPGGNYVLSTSSDLMNWTSEPFLAETNRFSLPLETSGPRNFIRLVRLQ